MRLLEDSLAEEILAGKINEGDIAVVDVGENGQIIVSKGEAIVMDGSDIARPIVFVPKSIPMSLFFDSKIFIASINSLYIMRLVYSKFLKKMILNS